MVSKEFFKIFGKRPMQLLFIGMFILNGALLLVNEFSKKQDYPPSAYKAIIANLQGLAPEEALAKLERESEELRIMIDLQLFGQRGGQIEQRFAHIDATALIDKYKSGNYLQYTDNVWQEDNLYRQMTAALKVVHEYDLYLQKIDDEAATLSSISIFAKPGTFAYRNIQKTPQDFAHLKGNELSFDVSRGIVMATQFVATDFIAILLIVVVCIMLMTREKEQACLNLIKTTYRGRVPLAIAKLAVALLACFIIEAILYATNFAIANHLYGFGSLDRYIQSVAGYLGSALNITVGQYLILFVVAKLFVYMFIAIVIYLITIIARNSLEVYIAVASLFGLSGILYATISNTSIYIFFKYVNIVSFINTATLFSNYLNLNIGGYPVRYEVCFIVVLGLGIIGCAVAAIIVFSRQKEMTGRQTIASIRQWLARIWPMRGHEHVGLVRHEVHKLLIVNRVLLILGAFFVLQMYVYEPMSERFADVDALYYKRYMLQLEGPLTEKTNAFLAEEQERFDRIIVEFQSMNESSSEDASMVHTYAQDLAPLNAFHKVLERVDYLNMRAVQHHDEGWLLYDIGYALLTAERGNMRDLQLALFSMIMLIACITPLMTYEYGTGMIRVIGTTLLGRQRLMIVKLSLAGAICTIIFIGVYAPEFYNILNAYGTRALAAPAFSMPHLTHIKMEMTILQYFVVLNVLRFIGFALACIIIFSLAMRLRSLINVMLAATGILLLPLLLAIVNIEIFDYILLTPIVTGNVIFKPYSFALLQQHRLVYLALLAITFLVVSTLLFRDVMSRFIRRGRLRI